MGGFPIFCLHTPHAITCSLHDPMISKIRFKFGSLAPGRASPWLQESKGFSFMSHAQNLGAGDRWQWIERTNGTDPNVGGFGPPSVQDIFGSVPSNLRNHCILTEGMMHGEHREHRDIRDVCNAGASWAWGNHMCEINGVFFSIEAL